MAFRLPPSLRPPLSVQPGDVLALHEELVGVFADTEDPISPSGTRDIALLESACARPHTGLGGVLKYSTLVAQAAALFHSLVKNHPFHNGNKRTALLTLIHVLADHHRRITANDVELFEFVVAVAAGTVPGCSTPRNTDEHVEQIRHWLTANSSALPVCGSSMRIGEFLEQCTRAGCTVREKDGGWLVRGPYGKTIRIAGSTRKIDGPAIKRYVGMLEISEGITGLPFSEFQSGLERDRQSIVQYMTVFRWLAAT